jgi:hypothetical protein
VQDSTVSFERFESDVRFSYGCPSCSFMVDASAVGAVNDATPGVVFTLKPEGKQLEMACQASQCDVTEPLSESRSETQMLLRGGKRNISPPRRILFTVSRN